MSLSRPALVLALFVGASIVWIQANQNAGATVAIDPDDIGGVVTGPQGPEAGVWVIAETTELPTQIRKIVVTDEAGRYVLPDLPRATYRIWVRGYGLVDSAPVRSTPGRRLDLIARVAPDARAAAAIYPANYWYSLIDVPPKEEFPGTGARGNGIGPAMKSQADWIDQMKTGCELCHQLGTRATREILRSLPPPGASEAWERRIRVGQDGGIMIPFMGNFGRRGIVMFADWTDRIAAGEVPPAPPRPQGRERSIVLTLWDWGGPASFVHDEVTTDKRNPTVNARGPLYGVDYGTDTLVIVDPIRNAASSVKVPVRDPASLSAKPQSMPAPSPYWGSDIYWTDPAHPHNPMLDAQGRVWITQGIRPVANPAWCKAGSSNPYARYFPLERSGSQASVYDPTTRTFTFVDTCFGTHHLQFAEDRDDTLYFSSAPVLPDSPAQPACKLADCDNVIGWIKFQLRPNPLAK